MSPKLAGILDHTNRMKQPLGLARPSRTRCGEIREAGTDA